MTTRFGRMVVDSVRGVNQHVRYFRRDTDDDSCGYCEGCTLMRRVSGICKAPRTMNSIPKFGFPPAEIKYTHRTSFISKSVFYKWFIVCIHAIELNVYKDVKLCILEILAKLILNLKNSCYFKALERIRELINNEPILTGNIHSLKRLYYSYTGQILRMKNGSIDFKRQTYINEIMKQHAIRRRILLENLGNLLFREILTNKEFLIFPLLDAIPFIIERYKLTWKIRQITT